MSPQLKSLILDSQWAKNLAADHLERLCLDVFERSYEPGATICSAGAPADHWLGVLEGMVKVEVACDGRPTTFAGVPAGSWFGEGSVLKREPRPYSVVALRPSKVACVPRRTFEWLLDSSFSFNRFVLEQLNARCGHYIALLESLRLRQPTARVAFALAALFDPQLYPATDRRLYISQEEVAKLAGLSRQSTNRALSGLEAAGLLCIEYRALRILDVQGLRKAAQSNSLQPPQESSATDQQSERVLASARHMLTSGHPTSAILFGQGR